MSEQEEVMEGTTAAALLRQVSTMFDEKIGGLKRALVDEQKTLSLRIDKKLKTTEKTFKKKSNRIQFELNSDVKDSLAEAKMHLQGPSPSIEKAVEHLDSGTVVLAERNRMIELADVSEYGWSTVEEYLQRPLAEDSDDDRRIRRAEVSVGRKINRKKSYQRGRYQYRRGGYNHNNHYNSNSNNNNYNNGDYSSSRGSNQPFRGSRGRGFYPRGRCFACGVRGHWARDCQYDPDAGVSYSSTEIGGR